ncbi:MAG: hypothetical protein IIB06_00660 [Bacteroidetes bacterium]|nr:hypothetical protein [Bacteroidota bacterium]
MKTRLFKQLVIILCISLFYAPILQGQEIDNSFNKTPQQMYDMFMRKNKTNKILGYIFLGSGVAIIAIGATITASTNIINSSFNVENDSGAEALFIVGGGVALASIPFFISAGSNKRKAILALKSGTVEFGTFDKTNHLSVSITIPF